MHTTRVSVRIDAPRSIVYALLLDALALATWRVPDGMRGEVHEFDPREGGAFRVSLTYETAGGTGTPTPGKSAERTDTYRGEFVRLVPDREVVESLAFETSDPAFAGRMRLTTTLADAADGGTDVLVVHEGVPDAVTPADNEAGTRSALVKLAALAEARAATAGRRPTKADLAAAHGRRIPDVVATGLKVLLVGINPSLWSGWSGHHFGRPSNRLWRTLHESGLTARQLRPEDTAELLASGLGVTNLVGRATARADELSDEEIRAGVPRLRDTVARWRPENVAVLGVSAYRVAFRRPRAAVGPQEETLDGAHLWVLPNPSGLNAHYQQPALTAEYARLRAALAPARTPAPTIAGQLEHPGARACPSRPDAAERLGPSGGQA